MEVAGEESITQTQAATVVTAGFFIRTCSLVVLSVKLWFISKSIISISFSFNFNKSTQDFKTASFLILFKTEFFLKYLVCSNIFTYKSYTIILVKTSFSRFLCDFLSALSDFTASLLVSDSVVTVYTNVQGEGRSDVGFLSFNQVIFKDHIRKTGVSLYYKSIFGEQLVSGPLAQLVRASCTEHISISFQIWQPL